jgi:LPPG:FO 2-phospho-L-lactate transferase
MTQFVLLVGGVGGAKLADGLSRLLPSSQLTLIGNTGDDFTHLGLTICPDLDTVMYTLSGVANPETGWGRAGESWRAMESVRALGGPDWFNLGDLDLGVHLNRTHFLNQGQDLTEITARLCRRLGMAHTLLPMSNQPAPTLIETDEGVLPFQEWFVARRWQPMVRAVRLPEDVRASAQVMRALEAADVVIIAPSNPFVSVDPILNVYPIRSMLADLPKLVAAVSPIIGGEAVKGPAARMMGAMNMPVTAAAISAYYGGLIDLFVYDEQDRGLTSAAGQATLCTQTLMNNNEDRVRLAREILDHIDGLLGASKSTA